MAGGDGGWDPGKDLQKLAENPVDTIASALVNTMTFGLVGYENGKLKAGILPTATSEAVGEVSGRNVARKQAMQANDAIKAAQTDRENQRKFGLQMQEARERQMSGVAGQMSNTGGTGGTSASDVEQQMATDFLGL